MPAHAPSPLPLRVQGPHHCRQPHSSPPHLRLCARLRPRSSPLQSRPAQCDRTTPRSATSRLNPCVRIPAATHPVNPTTGSSSPHRSQLKPDPARLPGCLPGTLPAIRIASPPDCHLPRAFQSPSANRHLPRSTVSLAATSSSVVGKAFTLIGIRLPRNPVPILRCILHAFRRACIALGSRPRSSRYKPLAAPARSSSGAPLCAAACSPAFAPRFYPVVMGVISTSEVRANLTANRARVIANATRYFSPPASTPLTDGVPHPFRAFCEMGGIRWTSSQNEKPSSLSPEGPRTNLPTPLPFGSACARQSHRRQ
jgi:hypothetical protein